MFIRFLDQNNILSFTYNFNVVLTKKATSYGIDDFILDIVILMR